MAEDEQIATHEAAHAVVAEALGIRVSYITIADDEEEDDEPYVGHTAASDWMAAFVEGERTIRPVGRARRPIVEAHLLVSWAGRAAERHLVDRAPNFWAAENDDALQALALAALLGVRCRELRKVVDSYLQHARRLVEEHWPAIEAVAQVLVWRGEITGRELRALTCRPSRRTRASRCSSGPGKRKGVRWPWSLLGRGSGGATAAEKRRTRQK